MTISIILATYNGEKFLLEQLASLKNQSRKADEVIIQDDGSTDGTKALVHSYITENGLQETWTFIENPENLGYAENFKTATLRAKGDIICFCDQDDIWREDKLELTEKLFLEHDDMTVLVANFSPFYDGDDLSSKTDTSKDKNDESLEKMVFSQKNMYLQAPGCTMAFRRELLEKSIEFWFSGFAHDEFVWKMGMCLGHVYFYYACVIDRRYHENNASMNKMRNINKRNLYLENLLQSYQVMMDATDLPNSKKLIAKNIKAVELRLALMKDRKYLSAVPLVFMLNTMQTSKTLLMEIYMSIRRKKFQ